MAGLLFNKYKRDKGGRHMERHCTQPKRPRNSAWFKENMLLVHAQESGQTDDRDAYDSDCEDISSTKAILMANLSSYDSDVHSEVPNSDTYQTDDMINQNYYSEDQYAVSIKKIRRIRACTHQRPQRKLVQYAVSREDQYAVLEIWNEYNILEDIKRGPYSKKLQYAVSNPLDTPLPRLGFCLLDSTNQTTWKEVDKSGRDELWAYFKELFKWEGLSDVLVNDAWENSMKKRYPDIMSKAKNESLKLAKVTGVQFEGVECTILKPYNPEWIKSKHWEDMIDRVWKTEKWLNKAISGSKNRNTVKEGSVSKHCAGSITISQHKRKFEQVHKRPPTAAELFELTHMKNRAFITLKSERVAAAYNGALPGFGWGSMSDPQYTMTGTPSTTRCTGAPSVSKDVQNYLDSVRGELKEELKEEMKVNLKEEMKAGLKEEMKAKRRNA
ncbi:transposase, Ptta/En/Spm [Tanacetum coccineum]